MSMEQVKLYTEAILPVDFAVESQDPDLLDILVQYLETPDSRVGDAKFNMLWSQERFDFPVSRNVWRTLTKAERFNGREDRIPKLSDPWRDDSEIWRSDPLEWRSVLLLSAIRDRQLLSVQVLAKGCADIDGLHALNVAACRNDPRYVQCLIQNGADPNHVDGFGRSALHEAVMNGFMDTMSALIEGGADVNKPMLKDKLSFRMGAGHKNKIITPGFIFKPVVEGASALMQACGLFLSGENQPPENNDLAMQIIRFLLSKGANTKMKDAAGMTALHYALLKPHLPLIKLLLEFGSPVDVVDEDGLTPFHYLVLSSLCN
ncbi:ankyrin repeat domain-containing protein [Aspergillus glaucus CBS 516.65]|uniref:Uncharacterized protein n=1 Tax=Aspergillus glaucus CBS 516.65 TaxID=1160497 RepID=A0A1L9VA22_ASPGL|nr:hypothetical protein ASPGLDRAFT_51087 [Aspergillus glaucus CBS 516.65]OJJ80682.1 hypothetical protein ASPGLDRAFT_51087 [Aspergillus glaucus CBS 516.65]